MLLIVGLLGGCSKPSRASGYEIVKGKGIDVCEAYVKNLNSLKPTIPMQCYRKTNSDFKDFSKPKLNRLDFSKGIMDRLDDFFWERDANPIYYVYNKKIWQGSDAQYEKAKKGYLNDRQGRFWIGHFVTDIDIDNDGKIDKVYLDQTCGSTYGSLMLILKDDLSDIDYKKSEIVLRHPSRKNWGVGVFQPVKQGDWGVSGTLEELKHWPAVDAMHSAYYDIFKFKNKSYFDLWWRNHPNYKGHPSYKVGRLHVYLAEENSINEVCTLKFNIDN